MSPTYAAEKDADVEVIEVKGIRGSMIKSMDLKRDSSGIIDAISAEDIGKFPDTNLAESLQRISGVSIDRSNGEGNQVSVRGFGPERNLILLNGRQLPTTSGYRSFDFQNVASEGVSGVEVYKTSVASMPTGGIGASVNILTNKPLAVGEEKASVGVKYVNDESTEKGSATPELSGIYSNVFMDGKLGVSLTGSYAEREHGANRSWVEIGWRSFPGTVDQDWAAGTADWGGVPDQGQVNRPDDTDIYSVPQTVNYMFEEFQRKRTNGQLVIQYEVADNLTATLDYTYINNQFNRQYSEVSAWFTFNGQETAWTDGPIASPLVYGENYEGNGIANQDLSMRGGNNATEANTHSIGLNLSWQVNDSLKIDFDHHNSNAEFIPTSPLGTANVISMPGYIRTNAYADFSGEIPVLAVGGSSNMTYADMRVAGSWFRNDDFQTEIAQTQVKGSYDLEEFGSIDFGISKMKSSNHYQTVQVQRNDWGGVGQAGDFDADMFHEEPVLTRFDASQGDFSALPGNYEIVNSVIVFDFNAVVARAAELYTPDSFGPGEIVGDCGNMFCASSDYQAGTDRFVEENMTSFYAQYNYEGELFDMLFDLHVGIRHEETEVLGQSYVPTYDSAIWEGDTEITLQATGLREQLSRDGEYSHTLPSINLNVEVTDDLMVRAAYSQTIGRPHYNDLAGGTTVSQSLTRLGGNGSSGNPGLLPLEAENIDLSVEWYYDEGSYASVAYFNKSVSNGIALDQISETIFSIPNPADGPKYQEAVNAVGSDAAAIRQYIYDNYADGETVFLDPDTGQIQIVGTETDNLASFLIQVPTNGDDTQSYDGYEFTVQHLLGESGFGVVANFTVVNTESDYDNYALEDTGAEIGISDTANLILFYDKDGLQTRIAYNWRDAFLSQTYQGTGQHPVYTEAYQQLDFNVSYDVAQIEGLSVFFEGINVTNESTRDHGRSTYQMLEYVQTGARYAVGARYNF